MMLFPIPICIVMMDDASDREFMTRLYEQYNRLMYHQVLPIVNQDKWAAEDVVQSALVALIKKIPLLREQEERVRVSYIISTCKNKACNYVRDEQRHQAKVNTSEFPKEEEEDISLEDRLIHEVELDCLAQTWHKLDEQTQYLLEARYILKKSYQEMAQDLGAKPDSLRMAMTRARHKAKELINQEMKL
jgi:RNA polymerase sigma-70 factor (ECF subfamily)